MHVLIHWNIVNPNLWPSRWWLISHSAEVMDTGAMDDMTILNLMACELLDVKSMRWFHPISINKTMEIKKILAHFSLPSLPFTLHLCVWERGFLTKNIVGAEEATSLPWYRSLEHAYRWSYNWLCQACQVGLRRCPLWGNNWWAWGWCSTLLKVEVTLDLVEIKLEKHDWVHHLCSEAQWEYRH